jgi:rfaE bifunctional protein nucleotidyltransferase chain/domain
MDTIKFLRVSDNDLKIIDNNKNIIDNLSNTKISYKDCVCKKPWGHEFLIYESNKIGIWFLKINKSHSTSLHTHFKKDTFIIVLEGCVKINVLEDEDILLNKLDSVFIPSNKFHGLSCFSDYVYLMEIEIFNKDATFSNKNDLLRINDIYNREITGYESSVTVIKENLDDYNYFNLNNNHNFTLFNNTIKVDKLNDDISLNNIYNILLEGRLFINGHYICEGSVFSINKTDTVINDNCKILSVNNNYSNEDRKIIYNNDHLKLTVKNLKKDNKKIVLTSGCYDILHVGHVHNLKQAKQIGDILMVCLSNDEQIKKLKGDKRPINNYNDRINIFKTLPFVDYIILYDETDIQKETSLDTIMKIVDPFCWTKGSDYIVSDILYKHPFLKNIQLINNIENKSTTNIINKISKKL